MLAVALAGRRYPDETAKHLVILRISGGSPLFRIWERNFGATHDGASLPIFLKAIQGKFRRTPSTVLSEVSSAMIEGA